METSSVDQFRKSIDKTLNSYFAAAFTGIVYKRGLCPQNGFTFVMKLGVSVPWFKHAASLEYVQEVADKLVFFMRKNIAEGAVLHVMIDKDKRTHVVNRFVFRPNGGFFLGDEKKLDIAGMQLALTDLREQCSASLLDILKADDIEKIDCPWFSRWSVSLGMNKVFMEKCTPQEALGLFDMNPNQEFFPWKKRDTHRFKRKNQQEIDKNPSITVLRPLRGRRRKRFSHCRGAAASIPLTNINTSIITVPLSPRIDTSSAYVNSPDMFEGISSLENVTEDNSSDRVSSPSPNHSSSVENSSVQSWFQTPEQIISSKSSSDDSEMDNDEENYQCDEGYKYTNTIHPLSSFQIVDSLMLNVYYLSYDFNCSEEFIASSRKAELKHTAV